jgi:hypothetical protein
MALCLTDTYSRNLPIQGFTGSRFNDRTHWLKCRCFYVAANLENSMTPLNSSSWRKVYIHLLQLDWKSVLCHPSIHPHYKVKRDIFRVAYYRLFFEER